MRAKSSLLALAILLSGGVPAMADETGLAGIHEWRQAGGRTCFVDHFHEGSGTGTSKNAAMQAAVKSWQEFTALEYGSDWGAFSNAASKSATCDRSGSAFSCQVSAIPCKGGAMMRSPSNRRVRRHGNGD